MARSLRSRLRSMRGLAAATVALAGPALAGRSAQIIGGIVDTAMVARIGTDQFAGVASASVLLRLLLYPGDALAVAAVAIVARHLGAAQRGEAFSAMLRILALAVAAAAALLLATFGSAGLLLRISGLQPALMEPARDYLITTAVFLPAYYVLYSLSAGFRAAKRARTAMTATLVVVVTNVVFDWLLIFGNLGLPRLEVTGAGLATGLSYAAGMLYLGARSLPALKDLRRDRSARRDARGQRHLRRIIAVAVPALFEGLSRPLGQLAVVVFIVVPLGAPAIALFHIVNRIAGVVVAPIHALAGAAAVLVGRALGAGRRRRAARTVGAGLLLGGLGGSVLGALLLLFPLLAIQVFTADPAIATEALRVLPIFVLAYYLSIPAIVISGALRGAGMTRDTMLVNGLGKFIVRFGLGWLLAIALQMGIDGVYWGTVGENLFAALAVAVVGRSKLRYQ